MVMKRNAMRKNLLQSILKSFGRYIAIVAIIALGASMFVGLLMTKSDMVATGQKFMDNQNMFDLRLISSYGWTEESLEAVSQLEGIEDAEGVNYLDVIVSLGEETEDDSVFRIYALPEKVNQVELRGGRMPENKNECLIDGYRADDSYLGTTVTISKTNDQDTLDAMTCEVFTIVGYVATPLYMDMNRGTTSVGNGSIETYLYIPQDGFDLDYYTEIDVTLAGDYEVYSSEYHDMLETMADQLEPDVMAVAQARFDKIVAEAEEEYADGYAEYMDGVQELEDAKQEANQELSDAYQELTDAEQELRDSEEKIADGESEIAKGWRTVNQNEQDLEDSKKELEETKEETYTQLDEAKEELDASAKEVSDGLAEVNDGLSQVESGLAEVNDGISQLESGIAQLNEGISQLESGIAQLDESITQLENNLAYVENGEAQLQALKDQRDTYSQQLEEAKSQRDTYQAQLDELYSTRTELEDTKKLLEDTKKELEDAQEAIDQGYADLQTARETADEQFTEAEAQIADGEKQIASAKKTLRSKEREIADGKEEIAEGWEEVNDGWEEYYDAKAEAEAEIADAEEELCDAAQELADAREDIDSLEAPELFILDRTTNMGYTSLESASDIVQGVAKVFPAFFLLVAALVCITTMTRMIDEERTQIGTLKALGYSNRAIISKYLLYAGSGAVIGCGLGVLIGSVAFPTILWEVYKIMLYLYDDVVLQVNWWLCGAVVAAYTAVMLLVTWYCCRRALQEEPAELIRPKAPEAGKKIFVEYLPFWHKISFLNKVTIRNIFRYRQRLAMMLVGIGGCTALLVTGFGMRDSIVNVVDYQFEDVTVYDMAVYFAEGQTDQEQEDFLREIGNDASAMFYHQSSIELDHNKQTKEIYLIAAGSGVEEFMDFHADGVQLELPGTNEVLLSVGVSNMLGIDVGDRITMRNSDMKMLELTVCGIYDNYVYNYAVIAPETIEAQWGEMPEMQMAFVTINEGQNIYEISARISGLDDVMNVSISKDLAEMVSRLMEAMDLVVIVVVACAGALAAIVLYNLTNININERIREIATIKVLGFRAGESAMYVFKENLSLTGIGAALGLGLGYLLLEFVMSQIKIDFVWFKTMVTPQSYLWSLLLTILSAIIVDFIFYFKLDKINMAEALKSVE